MQGAVLTSCGRVLAVGRVFRLSQVSWPLLPLHAPGHDLRHCSRGVWSVGGAAGGQRWEWNEIIVFACWVPCLLGQVGCVP